MKKLYRTFFDFTWSYFHEAIVLNKYGITGEVPMDDGWYTGVQVTGKRNHHRFTPPFVHLLLTQQLCREWVDGQSTWHILFGRTHATLWYNVAVQTSKKKITFKNWLPFEPTSTSSFKHNKISDILLQKNLNKERKEYEVCPVIDEIKVISCL